MARSRSATADQQSTDQTQHPVDTETAAAIELTRSAERTMSYVPIGEVEPISLSLNTAYKYFARPTKSGKMPSREEVTRFLMLCKSKMLNPWVGDAWLIGFDTQLGPEFSLVTAYQALAKRADLSKQYDGVEAGIIVENKETGEVSHTDGAFRRATDELVGAWAKVWRKDKSRPFYASISLASFAKPTTMWRTMPEIMLTKCARAAAMREAFPLELASLFIEEEARPMASTEKVRIPDGSEDSEAVAGSANDPQTTAPGDSQSKVTAKQLITPPADTSAEASKIIGEFRNALRRCHSESDVRNAFREASKRTTSTDDFDELSDLCEQRLREIHGRVGIDEAGDSTGPGQLFETHGNAAEV